MSKSSDVISIIFGVAGLIGIGYAISTQSQLVKVSKRLDKSIDEIASDMEIDIPEKMVNEAVKKAVETEARKTVERVADDAARAMRADIRTKVNAAIEAEYESIKENVLKEATTSAAKIDCLRVRRDVEEAAKKEALKKFDDNLDDILEKFNNDLNNTSRIYNSIRETIANTGSIGKEFVVRLN